jgi:hypothetical protein
MVTRDGHRIVGRRIEGWKAVRDAVEELRETVLYPPN